MVTWTRYRCEYVDLNMPQNGVANRGEKVLWQKYNYVLDSKEDKVYSTEYMSTDGVTWYCMDTTVLEVVDGDYVNPTS